MVLDSIIHVNAVEVVAGAQGFVDPEDWTFLLTGGLGDSGAIPNPATDWLQERAWKELGRLAQMPGFKVYTALCLSTVCSSPSACIQLHLQGHACSRQQSTCTTAIPSNIHHPTSKNVSRIN